MDQFPQVLYRHGAEPMVVADTAAHAQALADGWVEQPWDAKAPEQKPPADDLPPTRAELEQKAEQLGIKVDARWGDKRLSDEIAAKLRG